MPFGQREAAHAAEREPDVMRGVDVERIEDLDHVARQVAHAPGQ